MKHSLLPRPEFNGDVQNADFQVSCDPPTLGETRRAVNQLKSGKAFGEYGMYAPPCVPFGGRGSTRPTGDGAFLFPIWEEKGDTQEYNNYRGVTLLSVPDEVLARIFLEWLRQKLPTHQHHEQSGFTPKESTVDCILAFHVVPECLRNFPSGQFSAYVVLRKALDSVNG